MRRVARRVRTGLQRWRPPLGDHRGEGSAAPLAAPRLRCVSSASSTSSSPTLVGEGTAPVSFVEFTQSARDDVAAFLQQQEGATWVEQLHELSAQALDLWPQEAPHWRVAAPLVVPPSASSSQAFTQALSASLAVDQQRGTEAPAGSGSGLDPVSRARCLRALCKFGGGARATHQALPLLASLLDSGGVSGQTKGGLAYQLPLEELRLCLIALAESDSFRPRPGSPKSGSVRPEDAARKQFITEASKRLIAAQAKFSIQDLHDSRVALQHCGVETRVLDRELRRRLKGNSNDNADGDAVVSSAATVEDVAAAIACARSLNETSALRSPALRQALLPATLRPGVAASLLPHALPSEGRPLSSAHTFVVAMAVGQITVAARLLRVPEIASALRGVVELQAQGDEFAIQQAARVLRALWPRVVLRLPHMGPAELSVSLRTYWWQLLYSRQELALSRSSREHPILDVMIEAPTGQLRRNPGLDKDHEATEELKNKLLRPVLLRLGEFPLKYVSECLTAIAPPVRPPDSLHDRDRAAVREAVAAAFPLTLSPSLPWWEDFWGGELAGLTTVELLELVCGLREANPYQQESQEAKAWWLLDSLLRETGRRLTAGGRGKAQPSVELSHFLLLRMCRVLDVWQGHEVEGILKRLLSSPDAMKPLPAPYFTAVVTALCSWAVPKELPMRLLASFLDLADRGEREVQAELWSDILYAMRSLEEPLSGERITMRVVQKLVPHLASMPAPTLAASLQALAAISLPQPAELARSSSAGYAALDQAPLVATEAVRRTVDAGHWDFHNLVAIQESLGKLGWYSNAATASIVAQCSQTPLLEAHAPLLLPLARACVALRIHHAPLLHKLVLWYGWCYAYLRPKPLPSEQIDELLGLAEQLCELSFQSLELQGVLAENLRNPNASPQQVLGLLAALARLAHFPPEFKEACATIGAESTDTDLASLSTQDLINAFNIHLCAVFDGPAALKHWLTEDEAMKKFFQVHTSQKWYQRQDQERTTFLQSPAYLTLKQTAEDLGLDLRPSGPGEVYHVELVSRDAKERLSSLSNNPPIALVCIKSKEQLRWYVPVTAEGEQDGGQAQNRCLRFHFMYRGAVQKLRHLQAMGYRPAVVWMSEWNQLSTQEERTAYLRAATGALGQQSAAFAPSREEDAYE